MSDIGVSIVEEFESEPVVVLGVNISENLDLIQNFIAAFGIEFPVLMDTTQDVVNAYLQFVSTSPFPLDYIIDQQGKVAYHNTEYNPRRMTEIINNLLNPIGVEREVTATPFSFLLKQNYPNPFNPVTVIEYSLPYQSKVNLIIYDLQGHEVIKLINNEQAAGTHSIKWDASNASSGIYFFRLRAGDFVQTRKMVLLK